MANEKGKKIQNDAEKLTDDDAKQRMEKLFVELEEKFKNVPEEEFKKVEKKIQDFVDGKVSWADLIKFPKQVMFELAKHGYTHFRSGRYEDAEKIFKVLSALDIDNPYFHAMMGAILQRQRRFGEAAAEYSMAIDLDPNDITAIVNRGEIYLNHGLKELAEADFNKAISLDKTSSNRWASRAKLLLQNLKKGE